MPATELIARLPTDQLGGAKVFRPCTIAGVKRNGGDALSAEELAAMPKATLRAMQDQRFIVAWPKSANAPSPIDGEPYVYNRVGTSTYDVVLGQLLNAHPLSKADAEALAAQHRKPVAA